MQIFLTKSSFKYLERHLELKPKRHIYVSRFEKYLTKYLSEKLYRLNGLHEAVLNGVTDRLIEPKDNYKWLNPPKLGRYHIDKNCKSLNADYNNWPIPDEIAAMGERIVQSYREWCKSNGLTEANDQSSRAVFNLKHQGRWGFYYQGDSHHADNSSSVSRDFYTLREIEQELEVWKGNFNNWLCENELNGSGNYTYYLNLYTWQSKRNDERLKKRCANHCHDYGEVVFFLNEYREKFQYPLMQILEALIIFELNGNQEKNKPFIEMLGIKPCSKCAPLNIE